MKNKYESKINELKNLFNKEKDKNQRLISQHNNLKEKINYLNNQINILNDKIKLLDQNLIEKNLEIQKLISQNNLNYNYEITSINPGEKIMALNFVSIGVQVINNYNLICKNTDLFVKLEERLYEDFPQFKEYDTYFEVKTRRIKRFKTLKDNNIKTNDVINVFIIDN